MSNVEILGIVSHLRGSLEHYYLNGGCYIFAKKLQSIIGGDLYYLVDEYHFILRYSNKYYDVTGNVTSRYKNCKMLTEIEFLSRKKLRSSIDLG